MDTFWYIPSHKDSRWLATDRGTRTASLDYLAQIAQASERVGFSGALVPTGRNCEDAWVTAASLAALTRTLRYIVAVRPGLVTPAVAARMTSTLDRLSGGRLLVNVVIGGDPNENRGDGLFLEHDQRYAQAEEFLEVWKRLLAGEEVTYHGDHIDVEGGQLLYPPLQHPHPPLLLGGSSPAGLAVAGRHIDTYLTWGEPPAKVAVKLDAAREAAAAAGRKLEFGIRLHIIARETEEEAWAAADDLIRYVDEAAIERSQAVLARTESAGQKRMVALHAGSREALEVSPNLWAGVGLVTGGAGTALVGSFETVAERIVEYRDLGIDLFILSGYPHLEEAYRVGEGLLPLLPVERPVDPLEAVVIPGGW